MRGRRLRALAEAECYARCYGRRGHDVQLIKLVERRPSRLRSEATGQQLRRQFGGRLVSGDAC